MDNYKNKNANTTDIFDILTVVIFFCLIFIMSALFWIIPDKKISEDENRSLQQIPEFSLNNFVSGKFMKSMNKYYADQFPFRDIFVGAKTLSSYAFLINENKNIIIAKDGYLIQRFDRYSKKTIAEKSSEELGGDLTFGETMNNIKNNCGYINTFYDNIKSLYHDIKFTFAVPPRKIDVMTNKLPVFFPSDKHKIYFTELEKNINQDIYFSLLEVLRSHSDEYIYYKTDHHWTTLGAYYAYEKLGGKMGYEVQSKEDFIIETASEDFYGTTWSKAGAKWIKPDIIEYYRDLYDAAYMTKIHGTEDKILSGFYDFEKLETKDKYSSFLGGINSHISVYISERVSLIEPRKKLLLIADSFGQCFTPFLALHYDIEIIDMRFFNDNIYDFIKENNIQNILILTNMENLSTQNNLIKLTRE